MKVDEYLDDTEVQTRMSAVIFGFKLFELKGLNWDSKFEDLGIDSLEKIAMITSFEHEFHTVFEDRLFDNIATLNEVKLLIAQDHSSF